MIRGSIDGVGGWFGLMERYFFCCVRSVGYRIRDNKETLAFWVGGRWFLLWRENSGKFLEESGGVWVEEEREVGVGVLARVGGGFRVVVEFGVAGSEVRRCREVGVVGFGG